MRLPLPRRPVVPGVLASFEHIDAATDAIRSLRSSGHQPVVRCFTKESEGAQHKNQV